MINTILDAVEFILEDQGEPQSPYWLASQMMETRLWRASDQDVRVALDKDVAQWVERSRFVPSGDGEWGLRGNAVKHFCGQQTRSVEVAELARVQNE
jgi:hypothetical protein